MPLKNKLTIYLIKSNVKEFNDIFADGEKVKLLSSFGADNVYYSQKYITTPQWVKGFFCRDDCIELQQTCSQVILIKKIKIEDEERIFALTFGFSKHLLNKNVIEDRFGLKVILNSIGNKDVRKLSKTCIGTNHKRAEEQLPKGSSISDFGFDEVRDLIKGISGKTSEPLFEKGMVSGSDSLSVSVNRDITNIDEFLIECYKRYKLTNYKANFSWLDNIKAITHDRELIKRLENKIYNEIVSKNFDNVWMAVPNVLNWEDVAYFKIAGDKAEYEDIDIEKVVDAISGGFDSLEKLKNKFIRAISSKDHLLTYESWSAFYCLIGEVTLDGHQYCISEGKWYEINNKYVEEINDIYNSIELYEEDFPFYKSHEGEDSYNDKLSKYLNKSIVMHKKLLPIGGGSGNSIESCDIYKKDVFIHVKRNNGSSNLSHLFNQGLVSARTLLDRKKYLEFKKIALEAKGIQSSDCEVSESLSKGNSTIVFGIINKYKEERPKIPFFSKVALSYIAKEIGYYGYKVQMKNITIVD